MAPYHAKITSLVYIVFGQTIKFTKTIEDKCLNCIYITINMNILVVFFSKQIYTGSKVRLKMVFVYEITD